MKVTPNPIDPVAWSGGLLAIGRAAGAPPSPAEQAIDAALDGALGRAAERLRFKGKPRQTVALDTLGRLPATRVLLIGLGDGPATPAGLRDFTAIATLEASATRLDTVGLVVPDAGPPGSVRQLAVGAVLGTYRFEAYKSEDPENPSPRVERVELLGPAAQAEGVAEALQTGLKLGEAVVFARDLVNQPPNELTPARLAGWAREIADTYGMTLKVFEPEEMARLGMGGICAVGGGSVHPPRLIHLAWDPPGAAGRAPLAIVGKGLTFDSGGLSIKPAKAMEDMYIDMAGGAAVLGLMKAIGELRPDVPVHGIIGAAENMPGDRAYRPSDILKMYNGKTVEVLNTDAEGRIVLGDALHYATEQKPRWVVDLATLTGACMVGLGPNYAGLFTPDEGLAKELTAGADAAGELVWRMPLDKKLGDSMKSQRADLKNLGGPYGGAITGALFLQNFVGSTPWAHLDIAGPSLAEREDGHIRPGGTGFGVLTLWEVVDAATR